MNEYPGKDSAGGPNLGTREWIFGLLGQSRYRARCEQLAGLELRRRPDCEPCLQSLVTDEWTPETEHHLGWCDSCRIAAAAIGVGAPGVRAAPRRRRTLLLALVAGIAIAAPLMGSRLIDDPLTQPVVRGGVARPLPPKQTVVPVVVPVPRSKPTGTKGAVRHQRGGQSKSGQRALPHTT